MTIHGANLLVLGRARDNRFQPIGAQPEAGAGLHLDSKFEGKRRRGGVPPKDTGAAAEEEGTLTFTNGDRHPAPRAGISDRHVKGQHGS